MQALCMGKVGQGEDMSKDECALKLMECGFTACVINGVVIILIDDENDEKKVSKAIKEIGYNCSWGTKMKEKV